MLLDILLDAVIDCLKELPFLFAAFLLLEALEHHAAEKMNRALSGAGRLGPLVGSVLGCVPQCGFSIMASEFYAGGVVGLGTLLAVYLSTSDEAVVILMSDPSRFSDVFRLVLVKVMIGIAAGYIVMLAGAYREARHPHRTKDIETLCRHCGCHEEGHGILKPALRHTLEVAAFLFAATLLLNLLLELIGLDRVSALMLTDSPLQPLVAALIGLIPNCGASVILTQLFMDGVISFGSTVAGLSSSAGLGLIVLFRLNPDKKENLGIVALLFGIAVIAGVMIQLLG